MINKDNIRDKDRQKLNRYFKSVEIHFKKNFNSLPFCNRCEKIFYISELEINHIDYDENWRFAELVCRPCHVKIDSKFTLPKFEEIKKELPKTILAFQKNLPGILIMSKFPDKRIIITLKIKLGPKQSVNPLLPLGFFNN